MWGFGTAGTIYGNLGIYNTILSYFPILSGPSETPLCPVPVPAGAAAGIGNRLRRGPGRTNTIINPPWMPRDPQGTTADHSHDPRPQRALGMDAPRGAPLYTPKGRPAGHRDRSRVSARAS